MTRGPSRRGRGRAAILAVLALTSTGLAQGGASARPGTVRAEALTEPARTGFQALTPARMLDTRTTGGTVGAGATRKVLVLGRGGVPAGGVGSVALNITATAATMGGYLTVWPGTGSRPRTSTVNFPAGRTVPNSVVTGLASDGTISIYNLRGSTHVVVDVTGWFPSGSGVSAITPRRVLDTRASTPVGPSATRTVAVTGSSVPSTAIAVTATVTVARPSRGGYLTVYPYGSRRPGTSSVNFPPGRTVAHSVFATVGTGGRIVIYNRSGSTHVVVDVTGHLSPTSGYIPLPTPVRVADTRSGDYYRNGGYDRVGYLGSNADFFGVQFPNRSLTPTPAAAYGSGAAVVNVTVTQPDANGYATVWPYGTAKPATSTLNFTRGETVANGAIVGSPEGLLRAATSADALAHLVIDVSGYFPSDGVGVLDVSSTFRGYAIGTDRIGVAFCETAGDTVDHTTVIDNLNASVGAYYAWLSRGRYEPVFSSAGTIPVAAGDLDCIDKLADNVSAAAGFNGVLGVIVQYQDPNSAYGLAGPGYSIDRGTTFPRNLRRGEITASTVLRFGTLPPFTNVATHELGHMLDWPHSFVNGSSSEYTNVVDLMSGHPDVLAGDSTAVRYAKVTQPIGTMGPNLLRAGWLDPSEVAVHPGGTKTYRLQPLGGTGLHLLVVRSGIDGKVMTLGVREKTSYDQYLDKAGVEIDLVQEDRSVATHGLASRQAPALGAAGSVDHVLAGGSHAFGGVTVSVGAARTDGSYPVTVTGAAYDFPALHELPALASSDTDIDLPPDPLP